MYLKFPLKYIGITQDYDVNSHKAIDLAWHYEQNDPIFACGDGFVQKIYVFLEGGNTIYIKYDNGYSSEFMHIRDNSIVVNVGDRVAQGQKIAEIGNTGSQTTGPHLHFIVRDNNNSRVDPKSCVYVYPDQIVNENQKKMLNFYYPITYIGTPTEKNINNDQIEIIDTLVNCREAPGLSSKILGYANTGFYNYTNMQEIDNYKWYQIDENKWVAYHESWANIYPHQFEIIIIPEDLKAKLEEANKKIKELEKELNTIKNESYIFKYICLKTDIYTIKLNKNETLYIKNN